MTSAVLDHPAADDPLLAASRLAPIVRSRARQIEETRQVPQAVIDLFVDAGLFHLLLPRSLGGLESDPITAARVVETLAAADASAGWVTMLAHQNSYMAGFLPEAEARLIWADGGNVAGTARPIGRAIPVNHEGIESYRISGRWPFASGSSHATWFGAECKVYDGDAVRLDDNGEEVVLTCFVPRSEVTVHSTWDTTGLRGTASNDYSIEDAIVPATRAFRVLIDPPRHPWALYRALPLVFINHGSHALGIARAALEEARQLFLEKHGWGGVPLAEQPRIQTVIAEATAKLESARTYLYASAERHWAAALHDEQLPELSARTRLATSHAATMSLEVVDMLHRTLATSAVMTGAPIERQFRDIHTAAAHVMVGPLTYEAAGRVEFGAEAGFPYF